MTTDPLQCVTYATQGLGLRSIFFLCYINGLCTHLSQDGDLRTMFANDRTIINYSKPMNRKNKSQNRGNSKNSHRYIQYTVCFIITYIKKTVHIIFNTTSKTYSNNISSRNSNNSR